MGRSHLAPQSLIFITNRMAVRTVRLGNENHFVKCGVFNKCKVLITYRLLRKFSLFSMPTNLKDVPSVGDPGTVFGGDCDTFEMVRKIL